MNHRPSDVLTIADLKQMQRELESLLEAAEESKNRQMFRTLVGEIEQFLVSCERVIYWGEYESPRPYAPRTLNMLSEWASTWSEIAAFIIKYRVSKWHRIARIGTKVARFFFLRPRVYFSEKDLPITLPFSYESAVEKKHAGAKFLSPEREYTESDLPILRSC